MKINSEKLNLHSSAGDSDSVLSYLPHLNFFNEFRFFSPAAGLFCRRTFVQMYLCAAADAENLQDVYRYATGT